MVSVRKTPTLHDVTYGYTSSEARSRNNYFLADNEGGNFIIQW